MRTLLALLLLPALAGAQTTTTTSTVASCLLSTVYGSGNTAASTDYWSIGRGELDAISRNFHGRQFVNNSQSRTFCQVTVCMGNDFDTPSGTLHAEIWSDTTSGCPNGWAHCPNAQLGGNSGSINANTITMSPSSGTCNAAGGTHGQWVTFPWSSNQPTVTDVFWLVFTVDAGDLTNRVSVLVNSNGYSAPYSFWQSDAGATNHQPPSTDVDKLVNILAQFYEQTGGSPTTTSTSTSTTSSTNSTAATTSTSSSSSTSSTSSSSSSTVTTTTVTTTSTIAFTAKFHVATTGNDANTGLSPSEAWRTIQHAADSVSAGDTVAVAGGTYNEKLTFGRSGLVSAGIVFAPEPNTGTPIVDGQGLVTSPLWFFNGTKYLTVSGFKVQNGVGDCVTIGGASNFLTLDSNEITACHGSGVYIGTTGSAANYNRLTHNAIHDNRVGGITLVTASGGYTYIGYNQVYNNAGVGNFDGIQVGVGGSTSHHVVVEHNLAYGNGDPALCAVWGAASPCNNGADQIDMGGHVFGDEFLAQYNEVRKPGGNLKVHQGFGGKHIISRFNIGNTTGTQLYEFPSPTHHYNETFVDAGQAIQFYNANQGPTPGQSYGGATWLNEVAVNLTVNGLLFLDNGILSGGVPAWHTDFRKSSIDMDYNCYQVSASGLQWRSDSPSGCSIASYTAGQFATYQAYVNTATCANDAQDTHSIAVSGQTAASLFVNAAAGNYAPTPGSPCKGGARALTTTTASGSSVTTVPVVDPAFFTDGWGLVAPDVVTIAGTGNYTVTGVDIAGLTLSVTPAATFNSGDAVTLAGLVDRGAQQSIATTTTTTTTVTTTTTLPGATTSTSTSTSSSSSSTSSSVTTTTTSTSTTSTLQVPGGACSTPTALPAAGGTFVGTTTGTGTLRSTLCGGTANTATQTHGEAVYVWTPDFTGGPVVVETCGTATLFDTILYGGTGGCTSGHLTTETKCNDDGVTVRSDLHCGTGEPSVDHGSRFLFSTVTKGTPYYIVVDGYSTGTYALKIIPPRNATARRSRGRVPGHV